MDKFCLNCGHTRTAHSMPGRRTCNNFQSREPAPIVTDAMLEAADAAWSQSIGHDGLTMRGRVAMRAALVAALAAK